MDNMITLILLLLLLLAIFALTVAWRGAVVHRRKAEYLEGLVERSRTLALQKDTTVKRQHDEITSLQEQRRVLQEQLSAREEAYRELLARVPEKSVRERASRQQAPPAEREEDRGPGLRAV